MAHKYKKINKEAVLSLFSREKEIINTEYIKTQLNCSRYSVIRIIEELKDDNKIKLSNHGYKLL
jgi:biotin operon repressor|nr:MAG TPA: Catabolite activation-like protein [Caudoviricetes sp.]